MHQLDLQFTDGGSRKLWQRSEVETETMKTEGQEWSTNPLIWSLVTWTANNWINLGENFRFNIKKDSLNCVHSRKAGHIK